MESELFHDFFANHSYEWVFSGIGVIVVGALMKFIYKHAGADKLIQQKQKAGKYSVNFQIGETNKQN